VGRARGRTSAFRRGCPEFPSRSFQKLPQALGNLHSPLRYPSCQGCPCWRPPSPWTLYGFVLLVGLAAAGERVAFKLAIDQMEPFRVFLALVVNLGLVLVSGSIVLYKKARRPSGAFPPPSRPPSLPPALILTLPPSRPPAPPPQRSLPPCTASPAAPSS
jgi:hypothetical protein